MRILYKQPGQDPRSMVIPNELGVMQQLVGGHIETLRISDNGILVMNEEGKLLGLEPNFYLGAIGDTIVGPVLVVGEDGEDFSSLTTRQAVIDLNIMCLPKRIEELRKDGVAIRTEYRTSANGKRYGVYSLAD